MKIFRDYSFVGNDCNYDISVLLELSSVVTSNAFAFRSRFFARALADLDSFRRDGGWYLIQALC